MKANKLNQVKSCVSFGEKGKVDYLGTDPYNRNRRE